MRKNGWSDEDREEYEELVTEALRERATADRRDVFLGGLDDAVQAQRVWALDVHAGIRNDGADKILRNEQALRRPRVPVARDGQVLGKAPREFGHKLRDEEGVIVHARTLFDFLTFEELREKRDEFQGTERAARVDRYTVEKLLTLEELVPAAANPAEACESLGITVEQFLADEAA